jgi:hypothetical protein
MELMNSDFYKSVGEFYVENPAPGFKIIRQWSGVLSWKLPQEYDYAMKNGVYVGDRYEEVEPADEESREEEFEG